MSEALDVSVSCPDAGVAEAIAEALLRQQFAACCQIGAPIRSRFRWKDAVEEASEVPLLVKTRPHLFDKVAETIRSLHPYETPAITGTTVQADAATLSWIAEACIATDISGEAVHSERTPS